MLREDGVEPRCGSTRRPAARRPARRARAAVGGPGADDAVEVAGDQARAVAVDAVQDELDRRAGRSRWSAFWKSGPDAHDALDDVLAQQALGLGAASPRAAARSSASPRAARTARVRPRRGRRAPPRPARSRRRATRRSRTAAISTTGITSASAMLLGSRTDLQHLLAQEAAQAQQRGGAQRRACSPPAALGQHDEGVLDGRVRALGAARQGPDLGGRAERQLGAARHDQHAVAVLGLFHEVRRDDHGRARQRDRVDAPPELAPRDRVDAGGRLVEEQDARARAAAPPPSPGAACSRRASAPAVSLRRSTQVELLQRLLSMRVRRLRPHSP